VLPAQIGVENPYEDYACSGPFSPMGCRYYFLQRFWLVGTDGIKTDTLYNALIGAEFDRLLMWRSKRSLKSGCALETGGNSCRDCK